jgi:hypothetical protein
MVINSHSSEPVAPFLSNNSHTIGEIRPSDIEGHAVDTEFLIVGAGPAGASLACFLGSYGKYLNRGDLWGYLLNILL